MFYKNFTQDYEDIFPYRENVFSFLQSYTSINSPNILDIGCGTGHYTHKFSQKGYHATGIDLNKEMILHAKNSYPKTTFNILDLKNINDLNISFDTVYSTGNVIAHISKSELLIFLKNLKYIMQDGGMWIFQVLNFDYICTLNFYNLPIIETKQRIFKRWYTEIKDTDLQFNTQLINKTNNQTLFKDTITLYPMKSKEYIDLHYSNGFKLKEQFASYLKEDYIKEKESANILVFQLQKETINE